MALARLAAATAVVALLVTLAPHARTRARLAHNGIVLGKTWARQIHRLHKLIADVGGPARIRACGQAVTVVPFQSILAWETDQNVADVGWVPSWWIRHHPGPIVVFQPKWAGWLVRPLHVPASKRATCAGLRANSDFG
jgi:hypothetical protein